MLNVRPARLTDIASILDLRGRSSENKRDTMGPGELRSQISVFPQGQWVVECRSDGRIVGAMGTLVLQLEDYPLGASWKELTDGGTFFNHDNIRGRTLFQAHAVVDPAFEADGVRDMLTRAAIALARKKGLQRVRAGLGLKSYFAFCHRITPLDYIREVTRANFQDFALMSKLDAGFRFIAIVPDYFPRALGEQGFGAIADLMIENDPVGQKRASLSRHIHRVCAA